MKKVILIGCPGAGKTTFAEKFHQRTGLPLYYLDAIWHKPDRTHISRDEFDNRIGEILALDEWIIDGNYSRTLERRLMACDTVILFDLPTEVCLAGARERLGKGRYDMPWIATELDPTFEKEIKEFKSSKISKIYNMIEKHRQNKEIIIFKSRDDIDAYINKLQNQMKIYNKIDTKELIEKGWSGDKKYLASDNDGEKYLLRISSIDRLENKKSQFDMMTQVAALGVPMCLPLEFGVCDEGVYSIQSWIEGVDAESEGEALSADEQYSFGFDAGQILKRIHSISAPVGTENWEDHYNRKIDRKIAAYVACPLKYDNGQIFIDYINAHRHLLRDRPSVYQHGDYHVGNMMIGSDGRLYIIDFDRNDFGDPWEEFNRIVWCVRAMPSFAKGMVDGYFDNDIPYIFWELLALYISNNALSSLPWAIPFGEDEVNVMINLANDILTWYDDWNHPIPSWYK